MLRLNKEGEVLRRIAFVLLLTGLVYGEVPVYAEWVSLSQGLPEAEIAFLAASPKDPDIFYAATPKRVYRRSPDGRSWAQILSVRGSATQIHFVLTDAYSPDTLYVATDKGVQKSIDAGKRWTWIYRGTGEKARAVFFIGEDPQDVNSLWLGTGQGLVRASKDGSRAIKISSFPDAAVYSVWVPAEPGAALLASSEEGIFKSADSGAHWEKVFSVSKESEEAGGGDALAQFQIEELHSASIYSGLIHVPGQNKFLTASSGGIFEAGPEADVWKKVSADMPAKSIRHLMPSSETFYAATARGVFQWDAAQHHFKDLSEGLPTEDVRMLYFHPFSGDLYAATGRGVYRYPKPELKLSPGSSGEVPSLQNIQEHFNHEPTVMEIQQAAVHYAEVYPEKIEAWRQAAMRKAMLPTVSLTADQGVDHNVDIDRGGTGDPDRFITGPSETNRDWHMGVSWDLGDLIWNDDQTSIDTRSKLMVELRGDILNEVTHLYFERRRLQVECLIFPPKELPLQIEKDLKLQELTADIDALTGGFLSARLKEGNRVQIG